MCPCKSHDFTFLIQSKWIKWYRIYSIWTIINNLHSCVYSLTYLQCHIFQILCKQVSINNLHIYSTFFTNHPEGILGILCLFNNLILLRIEELIYIEKLKALISCVNNPDLPHSSLKNNTEKTKIWTVFFVYFQSQLLTPHIIMIYYFLKLSPAHTVPYTNIKTAVSRSYSFITFFLCPLFTAESSKVIVSQWLPADETQCVLLCVSDSLQLVVMSCCVSVTVCSLLLCPFYWLFLCFYFACFLLSQLYSQYFTFSPSSCSCSQPKLNTVTQLWHCLMDYCCVMIGDCC